MKTRLGLILAAVLVIAGCTTTKLVENPPGSGKYEKVAEVDPRLVSGLEVAKAANDSSAPFNKYSGAVAIILGATNALTAWQLKRKNDQLKEKS